MRILVAEDNAVNQRLAVALLQKRGHSVVVASNGKEALAAFDKDRFDCILMDVQMPEMNGFEATAAIREKEIFTGTRTPIIAVTAHAMKGDSDRCIDVGMDSYISKPIQANELFNAIESLVSLSSQEIEAKTATGDVIDRSAVIRQFDDDPELLQMIIDLFIESHAELLSQAREAIKKGNCTELNHAAHSLKGAIANFHAPAAIEAAQQLEMMGRESNLTRASETLSELEYEIERMKPALIALAQECNAGRSA